MKLNLLIKNKLNFGKKYFAGRNNSGKITVRHRGCIIKRKNYKIDFKRCFINLNFILLDIRPIPKRTAFCGLIMYENGIFSYIISSENMIRGKIYYVNFFKFLSIGNYIPLYQAPYGINLSNIELKLGYGAQFSKSAGSFVKILNKYSNKYNKILIELKSGEQYLINQNCFAMIGIVSNIKHSSISKKKASLNRKLGFRSSVRGIAMNPVDHPHGGRTNGGRPSVTFKGIITKGKKTRKKIISKKIIFKRQNLIKYETKL